MLAAVDRPAQALHVPESAVSGLSIPAVTCHNLDPKGVFPVVVNPFRGEAKMFDEQRHLYSGSYCEKRHTLRSCAATVFPSVGGTGRLVRQLSPLGRIPAQFCG